MSLLQNIFQILWNKSCKKIYAFFIANNSLIMSITKFCALAFSKSLSFLLNSLQIYFPYSVGQFQ